MTERPITEAWLAEVEWTCDRHPNVPGAVVRELVSAVRSLQWELENQKKLTAHYKGVLRGGDIGGEAVRVRAGSVGG